MHKHVESFTCLGNEAVSYIFEHRGGSPGTQGLDSDILKSAKDADPDIIIYVGACAGRMPSPELFKTLKQDIAPTVCFVSDAADKPWWPKVEEYDRARCFSVIVALDGAVEWPQQDNHVTALTPLDPKHFPNPIKPHSERKHIFGFSGNPGAGHRGRPAGRMHFLSEMQKLGLVFRQRSPSHSDLTKDAETYSEAARHMSETRIMPNFAHTGSFERYHVKGRVVEAGWAGCLLLELKDSPAKNWFEPGVDYIEFETMEDVENILKTYGKDPEGSEAFGRRLRAKVEEYHSPKAFWKRILSKL